jgi:naphtho-gamma-pyrone polyketide synthase
MAIISQEAGLDLGELEQDSEFADYGIDSLLSLTISGRLREELGLNLPSTMFADYPSPKDLTKYLNGGENRSPSLASSSEDEQVLTPEEDNVSEAGSEDYDTSATSVAGTDDIIGVIRATIAEETGVASEDLTPSTSFSKLGLDSLLSLTIMGKLGEVLEMELPQTLFADNDTLIEVENSLGLKPKEPSGNKSTINTTPEVAQPAIDTDPRATSILLQGKPKTAKKALFLFPDGSGSATSYASLPQISPDVVVYGLNCPWMKTPQNMKASLEQQATKYLAEIRLRQPKGPYYFGGWSAGGICAYETAQQLARDDEETARLILIDSPNPVGLENPPQRMYDFFESLDFFGTKGQAPPSWLRPHFDAFIRSLDDYVVKPFAGPPLETHLIYARDGICKHPSDPRPEIRPDDPREMLWLLNNRTDFSGRGWDELVGKGNLKIQVLSDVNHFSMVAPGPRIKELSALIGRAMK